MQESFKNLLVQNGINFPAIEEEQYDYVLTKEDENVAINHAIEQAKEWRRWKMNDRGIAEDMVDQVMKNVDWHSKINIEEILHQANINKNISLWREKDRTDQLDEEKKTQEKLKERCNAEYIYRVMSFSSRAMYDKRLIVNANTKPLIIAICFFLSRDERFETELRYSFKKGLLIRGITGLGKTHCVKCVENNEINPVNIVSVLDVTDTIKQEGDYQINMGYKKVLYLDDVGTEEPIVNYYGTKISFFKNFIETIYLRNIQKGFSQLIVSTNLSFLDIQDMYGVRVSSRMQEMFNIIDVSGVDMRTLNRSKQ